MKRSKVMLSMLVSMGLVFSEFSFAYAKIKLNYTKTTLTVGKSRKLKISGTTKKVTWKTSNKKIATVTASGLVSAKKKGRTTISAKVGQSTYKCKVTVKNPNPYITPSSAQLNIGGKKNFNLAYNSKKVTWSVSKKSIASINKKTGVLTAKKAGSLYVYAKAGGKRYKRYVTIKKPSFSAKSTTVYVGQSKTLTTKCLYDKATYSSANKKVATISKKGVVKGVNAGTTKVYMKVNGKKYSTKITVPKMSMTKTSLSLSAGTTYDLDIKKCKATAVWSSDNTNVAKVSKGGLITTVAEGTTTITARVNDATLTCALTVTAPVASVNVTNSTSAKTSFNTNRTTSYEGVVGQTISASKVLGSGSFTSSDTSIALVSNAGLVMPMSAGTVTITNTSNNKTMTITITDPGGVSQGVDVSYHNGSVDFNKLKAAGVDFAIIRGGNTQKKLSTTNSDGIDLNLKTNIDKAQAAGMNYGIYWYMNSSDNKGLMTTAEAASQAATLAGYLKSYETSYFTLPIYLDLEQTSALITGSTQADKVAYLQSLCQTFENTLNTYGYKNVGIYSSTSWYKNYLQSDYFVNHFTSRWLAHYGYNSVTGTSLANYTAVPSFKYNGVLYYPDLWQTGSDFKIDGVSGYVDMNYKYD